MQVGPSESRIWQTVQAKSAEIGSTASLFACTRMHETKGKWGLREAVFPPSRALSSTCNLGFRLVLPKVYKIAGVAPPGRGKKPGSISRRGKAVAVTIFQRIEGLRTVQTANGTAFLFDGHVIELSSSMPRDRLNELADAIARKIDDGRVVKAGQYQNIGGGAVLGDAFPLRSQ